MKYLLSSLALFLFASSSQGIIIEIKDLEPVKDAVEKLDQHALVIFDMDEVALTCQDRILQLPHSRGEIRKKIAEKRGAGEVANYYSLMWTQCEVRLVDSSILPLLQTLKNREIKFLGVTASATAPLGYIEDMVAFRLAEFNKLGLNFSDSFPELNNFSFAELIDETHKPGLTDGIAFTDGVVKSLIIETILENNGFSSFFKTLVVIEDSLKNLVELEQWAQKKGMNFIGFHYTAVEDWHKEHPMDETIAEFQIQYLLEKGIWLCDEEAQKLLNSTPSAF